MSSSKRPQIAVQPLNYRDIDHCSRIASAAFAVDPHTIVKNLGRQPYDMYEITRSGLLGNLKRRTHIYIKVVDDTTGDILGYAGWIFRGISDPSAIPWMGPQDEKPAEMPQTNVKANVEQPQSSDNGLDSIDRLHALEDADMKHWISDEILPDAPCMLVGGLYVSPSYQSQGVGSALLRHGNGIADDLGLTTYVHSSHQAYEAYRKFGFAVMRVLTVDLDEYAPRPPRHGEAVMDGPGKWGKYIIRYMKRLPHLQPPSIRLQHLSSLK